MHAVDYDESWLVDPSEVVTHIDKRGNVHLMVVRREGLCV